MSGGLLVHMGFPTIIAKRVDIEDADTFGVRVVFLGLSGTVISSPTDWYRPGDP